MWTGREVKSKNSKVKILMRNNKMGDHINCSNAIECRRKKSTIESKNAEKFFEF